MLNVTYTFCFSPTTAVFYDIRCNSVRDFSYRFTFNNIVLLDILFIFKCHKHTVIVTEIT